METFVAMPDAGVFGVDQLDELDGFFRRFGYATLRGLLDEEAVAAIEAECADAQARVVSGDLPERYGTTVLIEGDAGEKATRFANYVIHITELSAAARAAARDPLVVALMERWLGPAAWIQEGSRFGTVYQDARPGRESSYTRIGWHSDWQSGPHLAVWPSVAFTIHVDGTSPANGFLRVVPGSHRWATPAPYENINNIAVPEGSAPWGGYTETAPPMAMPLGFDKVPGEIGVYAERGDILFHDAYLWHSAARATDDHTMRRHVRGGWYGGQPPRDDDYGTFVKNAAR